MTNRRREMHGTPAAQGSERYSARAALPGRYIRFTLPQLLLCAVALACVAIALRFVHRRGPEMDALIDQRIRTAKEAAALRRKRAFVEEQAGSVRFRDVAARAGLRYRWTIPGPRPHNILQSIGNGCAFLDYNNDGNLDVLLVGPKPALYQGDGHGHFVDVTRQTGLATLSGDFRGCAVGDYDNDGYDDIYLSGYGTGVLLHNERGRAFRDVTAAMGLKPQPWGASCTFADLEGSGFLDLFICNYVRFGPSSRQFCRQDLIDTACAPTVYPPLKGVLYRNLRGRAFADVTRESGLDAQTGNALGVVCADFDGTGRPYLAVANDETGDDLFQSLGKGRFRNISAQAGTRGDEGGNVHAGMGMDTGDYDNDGKLDLFVTTYRSEDKCLYHNDGVGLFSLRSPAVGIERILIPFVSFGCKFLDVDNNGWLDLLVASGHVEDTVDRTRRGTYRQPIKLLRNMGASAGAPISFRDVRYGSGLEKLAPIVGRGLATGDFDNDGRVDALVVDSEGAPLLLHNQSHPAGNWIGFRLVGTGRSNLDAYGAVVTVESGGRRLMRVCHADGSYLSSSDKRVLVGLGTATHVDSCTVRWPDGRKQVWASLPAGHYFTLVEGRVRAVAY